MKTADGGFLSLKLRLVLKITKKEGRTYAPLSQLKGWDKNPRGITKVGYVRLRKQIETLGEYKPLLVTLEGLVLGGNMRLKVYRELKKIEVWVSVVEPKNEKEMVEYALSDNDRAGFYKEDKLAELALSVPELDLSSFSVDLGKPVGLDSLVESFGPEAEEDDFDETLPEKPKSRTGKIYELGRHRLICGDATKEEDVEKLMNGAKADMVVTDPPYNVDYTGKTKDALKMDNDSKDDGKFRKMLVKSFSNMNEWLKPGGAFYIWHADTEGYNFRGACRDAGWTVRQCLIWHKNSMVMGRQDYHWQHEPCLYGWKDGAAHLWATDRKQTTLLKFDRPSQSLEHPTMKPIGLLAYQIKNNSKGEDIVLDLFGGSGSTLIAAERTGRTCYMCELDPRYCDVIRKRFEHYAKGQK